MMTTPLSILLLFVLGLLVGSFLSVLIYRFHTGESGWVGGRSMCPHCHKKLSAKELIPVISYFYQGGKCRKCKKKISWHYPLLEISTGLIFVAVGMAGLTPLPLYLVFASILTFIFFYDLLYLEIPDEVMIPSIVIAFLGTFLQTSVSVWDGLLGAGVLVLFFLVQIILSRGRWLGGGDLRIGAFMGLILGFKLSLLALFIGYLIGAIVSMLLIATGKATRKTMIAFGPFLVLGTFVGLFFGKELIEWYLNLIYL